MKKIGILLCFIALYSAGQAQQSNKNKPSARKIIEKGEQAEKKTNKELQKKALSKPPVVLSADSVYKRNDLSTKFKPLNL